MGPRKQSGLRRKSSSGNGKPGTANCRQAARHGGGGKARLLPADGSRRRQGVRGRLEGDLVQLCASGRPRGHGRLHRKARPARKTPLEGVKTSRFGVRKAAVASQRQSKRTSGWGTAPAVRINLRVGL